MVKVKKKKTRHHIRPESVMFDGKVKVDAVKGIVENAKILGLVSAHGYSYTPKACKKAIPMYEGARVNIDHPARSTPGAARSYRDRFGYFEKGTVHFVEGDGLRGRFRFNPKHAIAEQFAWDAENNPEACGFSHNAKGPLVEGADGKLVCESIEAVRSVDLVADAATTASLFEGKNDMALKVRRRKVKKTRRLSPEGRTKVRRLLKEKFGREFAREILEDVGPDGAAALVQAPPAGGGAAEGGVDALLSLIKSVLANPNISAEESIKQVTKRLKALKDMIPGGSAAKPADMAAAPEGEPEDDEEEEDDEDHKPRSRGRIRREGLAVIPKKFRRLMAKMEAREEREAVEELCEGLGFKPTKEQVKLLTKLADEDDREALVESWQGDLDNPRRVLPFSNKPRSKGVKPEGRVEAKPLKDWAAGLKGA